MPKRTITAVCMMAVFIPICIYSGTIIFNIAMALLSLIAVYEMLSCVGAKKNIPVLIVSCLLSAAMPIIPYYTSAYTLHIALVCYIIYLILILTFMVFSRGNEDFTTVSAAFMGVFYISVSFTAVVLLRENGAYLYLLAFFGPWVSDTFAYLCGRLFGKHKLIPEVSPKKTVEGSIGGIVFAGISYIIYAVVIKNFFDASAAPNYLVMMIAGMIVSVISQIGDLIASVIKRRFGIKDYGWIFPGHGGVLDRFDSVLLTAPVLWILSQIPAFSGILLG